MNEESGLLILQNVLVILLFLWKLVNLWHYYREPSLKRRVADEVQEDTSVQHISEILERVKELERQLSVRRLLDEEEGEGGKRKKKKMSPRLSYENGEQDSQ